MKYRNGKYYTLFSYLCPIFSTLHWEYSHNNPPVEKPVFSLMPVVTNGLLADVRPALLELGQTVVTPGTLCATQISHCHSSSGTSSRGGLTHSRWYTAEQVSQHSRSPSRWQTRQWSSYWMTPSDMSSSRARLVVRNWSTRNCKTLTLLSSGLNG